MLLTKPADTTFRLGMLFALGSAFTFGLSGPFAKSLMAAGWSPTAAVTARLACGALAMAAFATAARPGWFRQALQHRRVVLLYGLIPIAGAQLCYYNAVSHLSVGVALLLEYTAPLLVVGWVWASTKRRPGNRTLIGVGTAIIGIMLVLGVFEGLSSAHVNGIGITWGLAAAICAACYFLMGEKVSTDGNGLDAIALAAGGLIVGAVAVGGLGLSGLMPLVFTDNEVVVAGFTTSWIVPVALLALLPTAIAYTLGIAGIARLRPSFASLVGLSEVLFAVLWAWLLVGESINLTQGVGGLIVLLGLALARSGDRSPEVTAATWPDAVPPELPEQPDRSLSG
ncbi:MAG: EamA family transporter [Mycobacterium sp.]